MHVTQFLAFDPMARIRFPVTRVGPQARLERIFFSFCLRSQRDERGPGRCGVTSKWSFRPLWSCGFLEKEREKEREGVREGAGRLE